MSKKKTGTKPKKAQTKKSATKSKAKKTNVSILETKARQKVKARQKSIKSTVSKDAMDPFSVLSGSGISSQPDFGKESGYRGEEVRGLFSGPFTTNIINSTVSRKRSRYAVLTNPYAKRTSDILVSNAVGKGHRLISSCKDREFAKKVESLWKKWVKEADTTGQSNFSGLESTAFRQVVEGGECFVRFRTRRASDDMSVPLQLQLIEPEQIPVTKNENVGAQKIIAGIQYSVLGNPVIYHVLQNHPGDYLSFFNVNDLVNTVRVPAEDMLHLHEVRRPADGRGLPMLAQTVIRLSDLDRYLDAELVRKKAAALIGGFIRTPGGKQEENPFLSDRDATDIDELEVEAIEPGTFPVLPPGFEVSFSQPADVGGNFQIFLKNMLATVAISNNLTFEQLTGDLSSVNDRTLRASLLEFKRIITALQENILIFQFCDPVFDRWFRMALLSGALTLPEGMELEEAMAHKWVADPWKHLNPTQEIAAEKDEIRAGLKTHSEALLERGKIPDETLQEIHDEQAKQEELGLVFDTDVGQVTQAGVIQNGGEQDTGSAEGEQE